MTWTMNLRRLKFVAAGAVVLSAVLVVSGCSTFELEHGAICCDIEKGASESETIHGSLWGFNWSDHVVEKCEEECGIYRVEFHTNALFILASVASLGLYVPQTVEWWCAVEPRDDTGHDEFDPNARVRPGAGSERALSSNRPASDGRAP